MTIEINRAGKWRLYWGAMPIPSGAEAMGTVTRDGHDTGALLSIGGRYVQGNAGTLKSLPPREVRAALGKLRSPGRPWPEGPRRTERIVVAVTEGEKATVEAAAAAAGEPVAEYVRARIL